METIEQINDDFNVKKPKKKGLIVGGIIAAVLVVALILVYFLVFAKPQFIFNTAIDKLFAIEAKEVNSIKTDLKLKMSADIEDTTAQTQFDEMEKFALKMGAQVDLENKEEIVNVGLEYDNQSVIDAKAYYTEETMYMYLEGLFDKYIKVDLEEEQKETINAIFETTSKEDSKATKTAMKAVRDELKTQIKELGEFEKDKVEIDIADKEQKVTKSTLILSQKDLLKLISNMCSNLAKEDKFLEAFDKETRDTIKEELKTASEELKTIEVDKGNKVEISIYTKGITNKFIGISVEVKSESATTSSTAIITLLKEDKDLYTVNVQAKSGNQTADVMNIKIEFEKEEDKKDEQKGKAIITLNAAEAGKIKIEADYSFECNQGIDKINTENNVNATELTEQDMQSIMTKLMERPLIGELIKSQINNIGNQGNTTNGLDNMSSAGTSEKITTAQNEVKEYGYSVKFSVPTGFKYKSDHSYDDSKYYELEENDSEIDANVSLSWDSDEEYKEDNINWDYNYYKNSSNYKNVALGELKTIKIGNTEFKYQILSYESNSQYYNEKYQIAYAWCNLDNEHIFSVQLESADKEISEDIIKGFLNIEISH